MKKKSGYLLANIPGKVNAPWHLYRVKDRKKAIDNLYHEYSDEFGEWSDLNLKKSDIRVRWVSDKEADEIEEQNPDMFLVR